MKPGNPNNNTEMEVVVLSNLSLNRSPGFMDRTVNGGPWWGSSGLPRPIGALSPDAMLFKVSSPNRTLPHFNLAGNTFH